VVDNGYIQNEQENEMLIMLSSIEDSLTLEWLTDNLNDMGIMLTMEDCYRVNSEGNVVFFTRPIAYVTTPEQIVEFQRFILEQWDMREVCPIKKSTVERRIVETDVVVPYYCSWY